MGVAAPGRKSAYVTLSRRASEICTGQTKAFTTKVTKDTKDTERGSLCALRVNCCCSFILGALRVLGGKTRSPLRHTCARGARAHSRNNPLSTMSTAHATSTPTSIENGTPIQPQ